MKEKPEYTPSINEAQRWDSPDVFVYKGKRYSVDIHLKVKEVKDGH